MRSDDISTAAAKLILAGSVATLSTVVEVPKARAVCIGGCPAICTGNNKSSTQKTVLPKRHSVPVPKPTKRTAKRQDDYKPTPKHPVLLPNYNRPDPKDVRWKDRDIKKEWEEYGDKLSKVKAGQTLFKEEVEHAPENEAPALTK